MKLRLILSAVSAALVVGMCVVPAGANIPPTLVQQSGTQASAPIGSAGCFANTSQPVALYPPKSYYPYGVEVTDVVDCTSETSVSDSLNLYRYPHLVNAYYKQGLTEPTLFGYIFTNEVIALCHSPVYAAWYGVEDIWINVLGYGEATNWPYGYVSQTLETDCFA